MDQLIIEKSSFEDDYERHHLLDEGGYGSVFLASSRKDPSQLYAVKRVQKSREKPLRHRSEAIALQKLPKHPNIIDYIACYDDEEYFYIVTEYLPYGTLFSLIEKGFCGSDTYRSPTAVMSPPPPLTEKECRGFVKEILVGVKHMHDRRIVHR